MQQIITRIKSLIKKNPRLSAGIIGMIVVICGVWYLKRGTSETALATFEARRGDLTISVIEGGTVEALEYQDIRCEVATGYQGTKILKIVEEGYFVTDEDVANGKVLVELDSTELRDRLLTQEIQFQSTLASLTEARQSFDIQLNQCKMDIKTAERSAKFAYMDFAKYVGDKLAAEIVEKLGMKEQTNAEALDLARIESALKPLIVLPESSTNNENGNVNGGNNVLPGERNITDERPMRTRPGGPGGGGSGEGGFRRGGPRGSGVAGEQSVRPQEGMRPSRPPRAEQIPPNVSSDAPVQIPATSPVLAQKNGNANNFVPSNASLTLPTSIDPTTIFGREKISEVIDFTQYAKPELLGDGAAKQQLRKLMDDLQVAQAQLGLQETKLQGTERLFKKGFISKTELETEQMTYTNNLLRVATAQTALDLFIKYEFPKQAEEYLSKYDEALRALERTRKEAVSKVAQALAKLRAAEGRYKIEAEQRQDLINKIEKCTIRAKKSGLVIYASNPRGFGSDEQIREGATVRERQSILIIPDTKKMAVRVRIHESYIKRVQKGQKATVQVDAFPEDILTGEVSKVSVVPDSTSRWMNPDLKVYPTVVDIKEEREWLKPGMSAKVEILVKKLTNVVYIPLQAVTLLQGKQICYVLNGSKPEPRVVEVGDFNDEFIEIKKGLKEGERVLLQPPVEPKQVKEEGETNEDNNNNTSGQTTAETRTPGGNGNYSAPPVDSGGGRSGRGGRSSGRGGM